MIAIVIVKQEVRLAAEVAARQISPESAGESFAVPLRLISATEDSPTHWASLPIVTEAAASQLRGMATNPEFAGNVTVDFCEPENVRAEFLQLLASNGLEEMPTEISE